jgi:membrane protease subunit HflK
MIKNSKIQVVSEKGDTLNFLDLSEFIGGDEQ